MASRKRWGLGAGLLILAALSGCSHTFLPDRPVPVSDLSPAWSPSGRTIALIHVADEHRPTGLYLLDLPTGAQRLLLAGRPYSASWSPDDTHLVFADADGIHILRADGDSLTDLFREGMWPSWSPDGRTILFAINGKLQTIAIGDSTPTEIPTPNLFVMDPGWCPNGQELVASAYASGEGLAEIYRISASSGLSTRLTQDDVEDRHPSCSATGWIVWNRWVGAHPEIRVMDSTGAGKKTLANVESSMSWNPTGTAFVFSGSTPDGPRLYVMDADGSNVRKLTQ
jgi:Tol biopolymer transport system component